MQRDAANAKLLMSQVDLNHLRENSANRRENRNKNQNRKKNQLKSNGNLFNIYV